MTSMTYKEREDFQKALDKVGSMSVDNFQNECEKHLIRDWNIDNLVFDLAKALMRSKENGR
jgi:hypothetical protein